MKSSHLDAKKLELHTVDIQDAAERQAALDIRQSFIVQAPAGSGKTTLLTERVLALLAFGVGQPEECLCITFTQKAAAEMRERIFAALEAEEHPLARKVLERDAKLNWALLDNPSRLRIQTIDALCAELAQCMPLQSKLGSMLKITENPAQFYEIAANQVLESVESNDPWSPALKILLRHLDNDWEALLRLLAEMLAHRDQWLLSLGPAFFNQPERSQLEQSLKLAIQATLDHAKSTVPVEHTETLLSLAGFAAEQLQIIKNTEKSTGKNIHSAILQCAECKTWPEASLLDLPKWRGIAELLLTENNELRKTVTERQGFPGQQSTKDKNEKALLKTRKEQMLACLETLQNYPEFCQALHQVRNCPPPTYTDEQWQLIQALLTTLPILVAELMLTFQKQGQVDFIEIALVAHQALGDKTCPTDIALKQGYKTRHILVDEFQDTSLSQFSLLEKLTLTWSSYEGNTLFLVGDPMQSIYRFRRAEVSLFLQAKQSGINEFALQSLTLNSNFRSQAPIVDWINQYFTHQFPKKDDIQTGAIRYTAFQATQKNFQCSEVVMTSVQSELEEAEIIIERLRATRHQNPKDSMALLVRSRSHLKFIIPELERNDIDYQGVELERLSHRPIIRELLSLSRALIHLGDKIAWLSLLSSDFCGLSFADLELLSTFHESYPLFWCLQQYENIPGLSNDAKTRLQILHPILSDAVSQRERYPIAFWIRDTWEKLQAVSKLGVQQNRVIDTVDAQEGEIFFKILRETAKNEDIFNIGVLEERVHQHYATPRTTDPDALQIMTIHRAKGLEFDTVFLAGLGRQQRPDATRLLLWEERRTEQGQPYLLLAPIRSSEHKKDPIYEYLKQQEQHRAEHENHRLLYVAATRAKKRLYGFSYRNSDNKNSISFF